MKLIYLLIYLAFTAFALAVITKDHQSEPATYCEALAATYRTAANHRDRQDSPYAAMEEVGRYKAWVAPLDRLQAVDNAYFDVRYKDTEPDVVYGAVLGRCNAIDRQINKAHSSFTPTN